MALEGQITLRLDKQTVAIINAWRSHFDKERPGTKVSANEVIRALIARAGLPKEKKRGAV